MATWVPHGHLRVHLRGDLRLLLGALRLREAPPAVFALAIFSWDVLANVTLAVTYWPLSGVNTFPSHVPVIGSGAHSFPGKLPHVDFGRVALGMSDLVVYTIVTFFSIAGNFVQA